MSIIRKVPYTTGKSTVKVYASDSLDKYLRTDNGAVEVFNGSHLATYQISVVEDGSTGIYLMTMPAVSVLPNAFDLFAVDTATGGIIGVGYVSLDGSGNEVVTWTTPTDRSTLTTLGTQATAIKAKTDNLPASPAAVGSPMTLDTSLDLYYAIFSIVRDNANSVDRYSLILTRNAVELETAVILTPTITVSRGSDDSALINAQALTAIANARFKYDADGAERSTLGQPNIVTVLANVDGIDRKFVAIESGRDST